MKGIRLDFKLSDFATQRGMKINSFKLQDGTTATILSNPATNTSDFYHTKGDYLLGVKGFRGKNSYIASLNLMQMLTKKAISPHDACTAWSKSLNRFA